jgi:hypothetical protein
LLAKKPNLSNQLDSLKDTNCRLIDYVKSINKKVRTANSEKEFSEITENNKSRKIKEYKSKAETALWFVESYGLVPQYLKLESTDGQTVTVDFNPSSSKYSYQDLPEEERQQIKDLLFILEKFNVSESAYRELTVFCDGLPRTSQSCTRTICYQIIKINKTQILLKYFFGAQGVKFLEKRRENVQSFQALR